jgi:hypothetical protein
VTKYERRSAMDSRRDWLLVLQDTSRADDLNRQRRTALWTHCCRSGFWQNWSHRHPAGFCYSTHRGAHNAPDDPHAPRPFRCGLVPLIPILGIDFCILVVFSCQSTTGYASSLAPDRLHRVFLYGRYHSAAGANSAYRNQAGVTGRR